MYFAGVQTNSAYPALKQTTSFTKLVNSLNTKAAQQSKSTISLKDILTRNKGDVSEILKDIDTYKSLTGMESLYRAMASKRKQELSDFQSLTDQRDTLIQDLEAERKILENGGAAENTMSLSWNKDVVPITTRTLVSDVVVSVSEAMQVDTPLAVSDAPIESQITATDTTIANYEPPSPIERSLMKISAMEKKLSDLENKISEYVSNANYSDVVDQKYGLTFSQVPIMKNILDKAEVGSKEKDEKNGSLFMQRTEKDFIEETKSAISWLESQADGFREAISRLNEKYQEKYNITLGQLCNDSSLLDWSDEQNELLFQMLKGNPHKIECWG